MKKKLLLTIIVVFVCLAVRAQNRWTQKINFSSTAKIIGKVGVSADKISKNTPGLVGKTAKIISTTARVMSTSTQKTSGTKK